MKAPAVEHQNSYSSCCSHNKLQFNFNFTIEEDIFRNTSPSVVIIGSKTSRPKGTKIAPGYTLIAVYPTASGFALQSMYRLGTFWCRSSGERHL